MDAWEDVRTSHRHLCQFTFFYKVSFPLKQTAQKLDTMLQSIAGNYYYEDIASTISRQWKSLKCML
jgi:hypothetical protein